MRCYFDTSALGKYYHPEPGTIATQRIIDEPGATHYVSWLTALELRSALALKVRTGELAEPDFSALTKRFKSDIKDGRFRSIAVRRRHFVTAESLVSRFGMIRRMRTLDAIQVAIAQDLQAKDEIDWFVTTDDLLIFVAAALGVPTKNPLQMP